MKTTYKFIFELKKPWIFIGHGEPERGNWIPSHFYSSTEHNVCVRLLRGKKMQSTSSLMDEFAAALQFFDGFGENWHALQDCLESLNEWLPATGYVLVIENAEWVLSKENKNQILALFKTLDQVGEFWSIPISNNGIFNREAITFHVLFIISDDETSAIERIGLIAKEANVPVRF